jgi:hypothetical protein
MCVRVVLLAVMLACPVQAAGSMDDRAGLFSPTSRTAVQDILDDIHKTFDLNITIETIEQLPDPPPRVSSWGYRAWLNKKLARTNADEANVNGLYILIARKPRWTVAVSTWPAWRDQEPYTSEPERTFLWRQLESQLPKDPDQALRDVLAGYRERLRNIRALDPAPLETVPALLILGVLSGFWLVLTFLRNRRADLAPLYPSAVQGSLFGLPAAYWIYDRLYEAPKTDPLEATGTTDSAPASLDPVVEEVANAALPPTVEPPPEQKP